MTQIGRETRIRADVHWALSLAESGQSAEAEGFLRDSLALNGPHPALYDLLGDLALRDHRPDQARKAFEQAAALAPQTARPWQGLARAMRALGDLNRAEIALAKALALKGDDPRLMLEAAALARAQRNPAQALALLDQACASGGCALGEAGLLRTGVLMDLGRLADAEAALAQAGRDGAEQTAVTLLQIKLANATGSPDQNAEAMARLGRDARDQGQDTPDTDAVLVRALLTQGALDEALTEATALRDRVLRDRADPEHIREAHELLMMVHLHRDEPAARLAVARDLRKALPASPDAARNLANVLWWAFEQDEAEAVLDQGLTHNPDHPELLWLRAALAMRPVYRSEAARATALHCFNDVIMHLAKVLQASPVRQGGLDPLATHYPFHLPYAGPVDVPTQRRIGAMLAASQQAQARTPARPPDVSPPVGPASRHLDQHPLGQRPLVAFVSGFWRNHTVCKLFRLWVKDLDRSRFRVAVLHQGETRDAATDQLFAWADPGYSTHIPNNAPAAAEQLAQWQPQAIVYPELGMFLDSLRLAAQRLAPVQAVSWGHPATTGLPDMDLFLSSDLMEPDDPTVAQSHYSEQLVRLPGLSLRYEPLLEPPKAGPEGVEERRAARAAFGFPQDDDQQILFLGLQNHAKYRPGDDKALARILAADPRHRLVLIVQKPPTPPDLLKTRLVGALTAIGLGQSEAESRIILLPMMPLERWRLLNIAGDVFLDTPGWSGGNTTLEAVACGLPVVTWSGSEPGAPAPPMRALHSTAILKALGCPETICATQEDFVATTLDLARDPARRAEIRERYLERMPQLAADPRPAEALADALEQAIRDRLPGLGDEAQPEVENSASLPVGVT